MLLESQPCYLHPIHHFLVGIDHLALRSVFHRFTENIICVYVDADHDVLVTPLRCHREGARLVGVDRFANSYILTKMSFSFLIATSFGGESSVPESIFIADAGLTFVDLTPFLCIRAPHGARAYP